MDKLINRKRTLQGFSLVEVLVVIAIISILATLVINSFSNAAQDSREIMARQQQAVVQGAISNWVGGQIGSYYDPDDNSAVTGGSNGPIVGYMQSVEDVRSRYNTAATGRAKLDLVVMYLDNATYQHLVDNTTNNDQLKSGAMLKLNPQRYIQLPTWLDGSYPKAELLP